jgi:hypothetical protein
MLLDLNSAGAVIKHATEGGIGETLIAMEDALQGKTVDDVYTNANVVSYGIFAEGSEAYVLLADGEDVSIGEDLISAGDGTWKSADNVDSAGIISERKAVALEALAPSGANGLCRARMR